MALKSNSWRVWFAVLCTVGLLLVGRTTWAINPYPQIETFDNDRDGEEGTGFWQPEPEQTYNPFEDPNADGLAPAAWDDARTTRDGVLEEVPSGFADVTASSGDNMGVLYFANADGPYGRPSGESGGGALDRNYSPWSYQTDIWADSRAEASFGENATGGTNGIVDFWWTNALNDNRGGAEFGNYLTETGFTAEVLDFPGGTDADRLWRFTTTAGGNPSFDAPVNAWYTMEVKYHDNGIDGHIAADHYLWNQAHTELLYSYTINTLFLNPETDWMGGPLYSWFVYQDPNGNTPDSLNRLFLDNLGVGLRVGLGDLNNDGVADFGDIEAFEVALTDPDAYIANWNAPKWEERGDINNDGFFDFGDIEQYELLLVGGIPPGSPPMVLAGGASVPEPGSITLLGLGLVGVAIAYRRRRRA